MQGLGGKGDNPVEAAKAFEAYFLRRILAEVRPREGMGGDGVAGSTFQSMFEEAIADAIAETGQVGLAQTIARDLQGAGGKRAAPDPTASWATDALDAAALAPPGAPAPVRAHNAPSDPPGASIRVADAAEPPHEGSD